MATTTTHPIVADALATGLGRFIGLDLKTTNGRLICAMVENLWNQ